ncbi:hypothetical protein [Streptomyces sp. XD-27]|uniref:hypothetical protein n=1 Tax=Streptomyces sp. XD-27 TaxID=3062779 RepID=UPI0026F42966|nr:hypothetical protein [Streptomyces sp. XD-27]WKX72065.1 hypothetical protein Q3Y56_21080 [Streptomyces sp. XD-27]
MITPIARPGRCIAADTPTGHFRLVLDYWHEEVLGRNDPAVYTVADVESYLAAKRVTE